MKRAIISALALLICALGLQILTLVRVNDVARSADDAASAALEASGSASRAAAMAENAYEAASRSPSSYSGGGAALSGGHFGESTLDQMRQQNAGAPGALANSAY